VLKDIKLKVKKVSLPSVCLQSTIQQHKPCPTYASLIA
jgi:hypothetical protein